MKLLKELWYGSPYPCEEVGKPDWERHEILDRIIEREALLLAVLEKQEKETFHSLQDDRSILQDLDNRDAFVYGFRMGAKIMLEVME